MNGVDTGNPEGVISITFPFVSTAHDTRRSNSSTDLISRFSNSSHIDEHASSSKLVNRSFSPSLSANSSFDELAHQRLLAQRKIWELSSSSPSLADRPESPFNLLQSPTPVEQFSNNHKSFNFSRDSKNLFDASLLSRTSLLSKSQESICNDSRGLEGYTHAQSIIESLQIDTSTDKIPSLNEYNSHYIDTLSCSPIELETSNDTPTTATNSSGSTTTTTTTNSATFNKGSLPAISMTNRTLPKFKIISASHNSQKPPASYSNPPLQCHCFIESPKRPIPSIDGLLSTMIDFTHFESLISLELITYLYHKDTMTAPDLQAISEKRFAEGSVLGKVRLPILFPNVNCFKGRLGRGNASYSRAQVAKLVVDFLVVPASFIESHYETTDSSKTIILGLGALLENRVDLILSAQTMVIGSCNRIEIPLVRFNMDEQQQQHQQQPPSNSISQKKGPANNSTSNSNGFANGVERHHGPETVLPNSQKHTGRYSKSRHKTNVEADAKEHEQFPRTQKQGSKLWEPGKAQYAVLKKTEKVADKDKEEIKQGKLKILKDTSESKDNKQITVDPTNKDKGKTSPPLLVPNNNKPTITELKTTSDPTSVAGSGPAVAAAAAALITKKIVTKRSMSEEVRLAKENPSNMQVFRPRRCAASKETNKSIQSAWSPSKDAFRNNTKSSLADDEQQHQQKTTLSLTPSAKTNESKPTLKATTNSGAFQGGAFKWI